MTGWTCKYSDFNWLCPKISPITGCKLRTSTFLFLLNDRSNPDSTQVIPSLIISLQIYTLLLPKRGAFRWTWSFLYHLSMLSPIRLIVVIIINTTYDQLFVRGILLHSKYSVRETEHLHCSKNLRKSNGCKVEIFQCFSSYIWMSSFADEGAQIKNYLWSTTWMFYDVMMYSMNYTTYTNQVFKSTNIDCIKYQLPLSKFSDKVMARCPPLWVGPLPLLPIYI